ncbi:MAG TPA: hypothetical protein DCS07_15945 [Bdellovibrionales bacterium]|nr:MAG: hypothetical protein A2X97_08640 [Bdellovibrionales bacterium GWA1_52_35]HAR44099.1 hypothetical protein [Bdellovibrionales bacterium]HCM41637.1 hypothetical protein [Bdellovibrionales bacterium]
MKFLYRSLTSALISLTGFSCAHQNISHQAQEPLDATNQSIQKTKEPSKSEDKTIDISGQTADIRFFVETLEDAHPNIQHIGKLKYKKLKAALLKSPSGPVSRSVFSEKIQAFLHEFHDGHTTVPPQNPFRIPFEFKLYENRVFIDRNYSLNESFEGFDKCEIIAINQEAISEIIQKRLALASYEKEPYGILYVVKTQLLRFSDDQPVQLQLSCKGLPVQKVFTPEPGRILKFKPEQKPPFEFQLSSNNKIGILTFRSFQDSTYCSQKDCSSLPSMREVVTNAVREMSDRHSQALIIDIRNNSGGTSRVAEPIYDAITDSPMKDWEIKIKYSKTFLLSDGEHYPNAKPGTMISPRLIYGTDGTYKPKPVDKFHGKVILLMNRGTYSSANMFAYSMIDNGLAISVGEPPGNGGCKFGDAKFFTLPNSGLTIQYAHKEFRRPKSELCDQGDPDLVIDYPFMEKADDYLAGKDSMLDFVLSSVEKLERQQK